MDRPGDDDVEPRTVAPRGHGPGTGAGSSPKLEVSGVQVCASALAAVSAAVAGSFFGVTGTIAGAAMASLFATFGSAVYTHFLRSGTERLQQVEVPVLAGPLGRVTRVTTTTTVASPASSDGGGDRGKNGGDDAPGEPPAWRRWLAGRRGVLAGVALAFVLAMATVTGIELVTKQPLSGVTGGGSSGLTSIGNAVSGPADDDEPAPSTTTTTSGTTDTTGQGSEGDDDATTTTVTDDAEPAPSSEGSDTTTTTAPDGGAGSPGDEPGASTTTTTGPTSTTATPTTAPLSGAAAPG
jgi:hypothetical protein